jgi:Fanconi anemia group J protein
MHKTYQFQYEAQAFRALFQAIGRCIRHIHDLGSIFLLDERLQEKIDKFPDWVKSSFVVSENVSQELKNFYQTMLKNMILFKEMKNILD